MSSIVRKVREFGADQRGMALILVSVMLPVIIGFALLAIDMSRANNLHNDLQKGADAFALAGAAELDGGSDAWVRAERALANLVQNDTRFSDWADLAELRNGSVVNGTTTCRTGGDITWCFLKSIPASDASPITSANYSATPQETRFIQVKINEPTEDGVFTFKAMFPAAFLGGNGDFNFGAEAVAGFNSAVCDFTPVFICNPYEMVNGTNDAGGVTLQQAAAERKYRRRLVQLRTVGGGAAYFPGNFGFLSTDGNGAKALAIALASAKPQVCYDKRSITTETGEKAGKVKAAINLRFGLDEPGSGNAFKAPEFGPAQNVRKGGKRTNNANTCPSISEYDFDVSGETEGLGLDKCFATGSCPYMGGRMGTGNWGRTDSTGTAPWAVESGSTLQATQYWKINHRTGNAANAPPKPLPSGLTGTGDDFPTRYEVYRAEIPSYVADQSPAPAKETGEPHNKCEAPISYVDRRLLYGAIFNCKALEADPSVNLAGKTENLPVEAFASFFITQPIRTDRCTGNSGTCYDYDADIFVELVDVTGFEGRGTLDNFLRDEPQLYR